MNVGKSIERAMSDSSISSAQIADEMDISVTRVNVLRNSNNANTATIQRLAKVFDMAVSEFIALGE